MADKEGVSLGIIVCGPSTMTFDVKQAASEVQSGILARKSSITRELWLHSENLHELAYPWHLLLSYAKMPLHILDMISVNTVTILYR